MKVTIGDKEFKVEYSTPELPAVNISLALDLAEAIELTKETSRAIILTKARRLLLINALRAWALSEAQKIEKEQEAEAESGSK